MSRLLGAALLALALAAPAHASQVVPVGNVFPLADQAFDTALAYNAQTGTYLHVHLDTDERVQGRLLAADGTPGETFLIGVGHSPRVEADPDGAGWMVVWEDFNEIYAAAVSATGETTHRAVTQWGDSPDDGARDPALAHGSDPDCPWAVAFVGTFDGPAGDIYSQRLDAEGSPCGGGPIAQTGFVEGGGRADEPSLTFLPREDRFLLATVADGADGIQLDQFTPANAPADPAGTVPVGEGENATLFTALDTDPVSGAALLAYGVDVNTAEAGFEELRVSAIVLAGSPVVAATTRLSPPDTAGGDSVTPSQVAFDRETGIAAVAWNVFGDDFPSPDPEAAREFLIGAVRVQVTGSDVALTPLGAPFVPAGRRTHANDSALAAGPTRTWLSAWSYDGIEARFLYELRDGDGDGVEPPADCDDANPAVRPGGAEIPGNGVDEDCSGADAPGVTAATLSATFKKGRRFTRVRRLRIVGAPAGLGVEIRCAKRRRCPKRLRSARTLTVEDAGTFNLRPRVGKRLRTRVRLTVRLYEAGHVGRQYRFRTRRGKTPRRSQLCIPIGESPEPCA